MLIGMDKWYTPKRLSLRKKVEEFLVDETLFEIGSEMLWLWWVAIECSANKEILSIIIYEERNVFVVAKRFLSGMLEDMANTLSNYGGTWYPQACRFLIVEYHIHSPCEKSMIERTMQYIKDRT